MKKAKINDKIVNLFIGGNNLCQSVSQSEYRNVAVITTTIGRKTLEKAILSVRSQTYPCKHYVFVDGKQYWANVEPLLKKYPEVIFTFLPMNTGGENDIGNGGIHAILPYLLKEDIFCFLDDDNWHEPEHVEYLANMIVKYQLDYAYSLRYLYDDNGTFISKDCCGSIGFWKAEVSVMIETQKVGLVSVSNNSEPLIDTNSYALTRKISFELSESWYSGTANDRTVFRKLLSLNAKGGFTGKCTTHYKLTPIFDREQFYKEEIYQAVRLQNEKVIEMGITWDMPTIYTNNELIALSENR
ncbi:TPA: glycosyltransferase family 2 protein [Haemophilus influenzae]